MIEWFYATMASSAVAQGVLAGALAAAPISIVLYLLRNVPLGIWNFFLRQISQHFVVLSSLDNYQDVVDFASEYIVWTRNTSVTSSYSKGKRHYKTVLGYGPHYGKYKGVFFKIVKQMEESQATEAFKEKVSFTFFARKNTVMLDFFDHSTKAVSKVVPHLYIAEDGYWDKVGPLAPRPFETVIFDRKEEIMDFLLNFQAREQEYMLRGMPYHTGILLHGEPGTGKTSIINAVANKLDKNIYYLNPSSLNKASLQSMFSGDWSERILVIEDIDVSGMSTNRDDDKGVTLSELLNSLDGLTTPQGMITIATTNRIESLDPALTRPGRFDMCVEVGKLSLNEATQMAKLFEDQLPHPYVPQTGAELRNHFLKNNS